MAEEPLLVGRPGTRLCMELDRVPLWRGDHVSVRQLAEDFARYHDLPRLAGPDVLVGSVRDGLGLLMRQQDGFAYADSYDEAARRCHVGTALAPLATTPPSVNPRSSGCAWAGR
jgi:hypothetical protein